jgi:catalase (peroxidase I)
VYNAWEVHLGPGGRQQWKQSANDSQPVMMLTTDMALISDPVYLPLATLFANNMTALEDVFSHAWCVADSRARTIYCLFLFLFVLRFCCVRVTICSES